LALVEGAVRSARRREEAAKHSWEMRVDQIESVIRSVSERRKAMGPNRRANPSAAEDAAHVA
jgi:hypothetical protein